MQKITYQHHIYVTAPHHFPMAIEKTRRTKSYMKAMFGFSQFTALSKYRWVIIVPHWSRHPSLP